MFRVTNKFFIVYDINWSNCINVCTDGASAMVSESRGFAALVKREIKPLKLHIASYIGKL